MAMKHPLMNAENALHASHFTLGWLAGSKAYDDIIALPRPHAEAIVRQVRAIEAQCQELHARQSDLAQTLETLLQLLHQHLGVQDSPWGMCVAEADDAGDEGLDAVEDNEFA
jgi:hypothetical protein